jgi:N-acetyl-gamma-glutamyl-phosphate reductase
MQTIPVGIIGASGYSGLELSRILAAHPHVELRLLASDRWQGDTAGRRAGLLGAAGKLKYAPQEKAAELARECAAVFLATPAEVSMELAPACLAGGGKVIDLSGAFRLKDPAAFEKHYGMKHLHSALLDEAFYGLPELARTPEGTRLVANPGCYPTAAALALAPLYEQGLLAEEGVIVDAASGVTGAGRKASDDFAFAEVDGDFKAYRVLRHQHSPEIAQSLARAAAREVRLTFTAHLLPARRGILATCYARLAPGRTAAELGQALLHKYAGAEFVQVLKSPDEVNLKSVTGTNLCQLAVACASEGDPGRVVVISAIDNLVKGAAGQAVQNLNLTMGWPEAAGLQLRGFHP